MKTFIAILAVVFLYAACTQNTTLVEEEVSAEEQKDKIIHSSVDTITPVFGYRFTISGDFNGDGKEEKLTEHYYSSIDNKESNKFYEGLPDYTKLVELTIKKDPRSFVTSGSKFIDTLHISQGGQLLGLSYLKNEGDLNGDGTDELSYVVNWADWSNVNTWHLMTNKNGKWRELYSFGIWDWQLPNLPGVISQYGVVGLEDKIINTENDSLNQHLKKELKSFKGLIRKIETNTIEVICRNEEALMDTMILDLKKVR